MASPEQEFFKKYLAENGGSHESAFFAVMAEVNETLEKMRARMDCQSGACPGIPEAQMEDLVEKAAKKAVEQLTTEFYKSVGQTVVNRAFILVGGLTVALVLFLKSKGLM